MYFCAGMAANLLTFIVMALANKSIIEKVKYVFSKEGISYLVQHTDIFGHISTIGCFYFVGPN